MENEASIAVASLDAGKAACYPQLVREGGLPSAEGDSSIGMRKSVLSSKSIHEKLRALAMEQIGLLDSLESGPIHNSLPLELRSPINVRSFCQEGVDYASPVSSRRKPSAPSLDSDAGDSGASTPAKSTKPSLKRKNTNFWALRIAEELEGPIQQEPSTRRDLYQWLLWFADLDEPPRTGCLATIVFSKPFAVIVGCVILVNAILTAISCDVEIKSLSEEAAAIINGTSQDLSETPDYILLAETLLTSFYAAEILLRLTVHRVYFFCNSDWAWNLFDFVLVILGIADICLRDLARNNINVNFAFMRILRIMKLAKLLRVVRVMEVFSQLRVILSTTIGSFMNMCWGFVMIGFVMYIFALVFIQGCIDALRNGAQDMDEFTVERIQTRFGSVLRGMSTLYKATFGGADWEAFLDNPHVITLAGPAYVALFVFFIAFINVALVNILTGIFVESAVKLAEPSKHALALEKRRRAMRDEEDLRRFCQQFVKGRRNIGGEEIRQMLMNRRMRSYLEVYGLSVRDPQFFYEVIVSLTESDDVDIDAFVTGCMKLRGEATSLDMHHLLLQAKFLNGSSQHFLEMCLSRFESIESSLKQVELSVAAVQEHSFKAKFV